MITNFSIKRLLFKTFCCILLFLIFSIIGGMFYCTFFTKTQSNEQIFSRAITEREVVVSNRNFSIKYEYSTNVVPYSGDTNIITIKIRNANISVFEFVGTNKIKINGTMGGVVIMNTNFNKDSDTFYVLKALSSTNN